MRKTFLFILALCATMLAWGEMTTGSVTYESIAKQNGWAANSYNQTLDWGGAISVTAKWDGNTKNGKSINNTSWRIYQKNLAGEFTINAQPGFIIKTIKLTYATNNKGVCSKAPNADPKTIATAAEDQIVSKTVYTINASSITLYVGVTEATTESGDITISLQTIEVTYDMAEQYVLEEFKNSDGTEWNFNADTTSVKGKYFSWTTARARHNGTAMDALKSKIAGVAFNGTPASGNALFSTTIEGGVKFVSFNWNQCDANENKTETIKLTVGDKSKEDSFSAVGGSEARPADRTLSFAPEVKTNATFMIERTAGNRLTFGPIAIVPYVFYTEKAQTADAVDGTYDATTGLINNAPAGEVTYSIVTEGAQATIGTATGIVDISKVTTSEDITIKASYENAYTTMSLHVNALPIPVVTFPDLIDNNKTVNMDAVPFTENISVKVNDEEVSSPTIKYESSNENAALVNETTGEVTIISVGTTVITATVAPTETYAGTTASYALEVEKGDIGEAWLEGFDVITVKESYVNNDDDIIGDNGVYNWKVAYYQRNTADVIGSDKALRMRGKDAPNNHIMFDGVQEGGIKALAFDWKLAGSATDLTTYFDVTVDGVKNSFEYSGLTGGVVQSYAQAFSVRKNTTLAIEVPTGGQATIFGPISITPYLLYTTKTAVIDNAIIGATYTNTDLINNIDEGAVTYSLISEGADDIAEIDADNGQVTVKAGGVVTVQAKWVPEGAEEDEFVTTTYELTINFQTPIITFNDFEADLDGTVTPDITVMLNEEDITEAATISYEVADKNIATWDATNGWKLKTHGTTQVTAKVERTAQYGAASATATMTVNTMTFAEGTFFTENFGGETTDSYSTEKENWRGKDNVYPWTFLNWRRYADHVRITMTKPESSNINGYIYMNPFDGGALEGGIKAVQVTWKAPGASLLATDFYVDDMSNTSATKVTIQKEAGASTAQQITQAIFNSKTNAAQLRIRIGSLNMSAIDVYSVDIVPYLLYTKKEVSVAYDLEGTNEVDVTENLINNLEEGETVTYSLSDGAQASIDGSTITLANVDETITVTAKWGEVSTTFTLKVTKTEEPVVEPDYVLVNKTAGAYATICLPKKIAKVENATLYSISYGNTQMIEFVEADLKNDDAGMPYLVQVAADGNVNFYYGEGEAVTESVDAETAKGFVGSLIDTDQPVPSDGSAILVSGGKLRIAGANCVLTKNHAYIDATKLPDSPTQSVGQRRTLRLYNAEVTTPTGWMNVNANANVEKIIRKGQLFIIREGKVYSAQGMLVK